MKNKIMEIIIICKSEIKNSEYGLSSILEEAQKKGFELKRYRPDFGILEGKINRDNLNKIYSINGISFIATNN